MTRLSATPLVARVGPLVLAAATVAVFYDWIVTFPFGLLRDDGYFYAQLAYNLGTSFHSSFDGIRVTDGYHPLWGWTLGALSLLASLVSDSKHVHLAVLCIFDLALIYFIGARYGSTWPQKVTLVGLALAGSLLMESLLLTLLVLEWMRCRLTESDPAAPAGGPAAASGRPVLLVFLMPLVRIDGLAIVAALGLHDLLFRRTQWIWTAVAAAAGSACHFAAMWSIAGSWFSVSSYIEGSRASLLEPKLWFNLFHGGSAGFPANPLLLLASVLGGASLVAALLTPERRVRTPLLCAWLGVALFTGLHLWFNILRPWYYVPSLMVFAYALFQARPARLHVPLRVAHAAALAAVVGLIGFLVLQKVRYRDDVAASVAFIKGLGEHVPAGESIFEVDGSGYVGFFAARPIVNGDGLMNTHAYARALVAGELDLARYLRESGICWVISNKSATPGHAVDEYGLRLPESDLELVFRRDGESRYRFTDFKLYRLRSCTPRPPRDRERGWGTTGQLFRHLDLHRRRQVSFHEHNHALGGVCLHNQHRVEQRHASAPPASPRSRCVTRPVSDAPEQQRWARRHRWPEHGQQQPQRNSRHELRAIPSSSVLTASGTASSQRRRATLAQVYFTTSGAIARLYLDRRPRAGW